MEFPYRTFIDWLQEHDLSETTAENYARLARAAFNQGVPLHSAPAFETYVQRFDRRRSVRRTAWRHWQRYQNVEDDALLPEGPRKKRLPEGSHFDVVLGFDAFLTRNGFAASTATQYAGLVYSVARTVPDLTDSLALYRYSQTLPISRRAQLKSVWPHFRTFVPSVAPLDPTSHIPDAVAYVLWFMAMRCGVQGKYARQLRWSDLVQRQANPDEYNIRYLPDPTPNHYYRSPLKEDHVAVLRGWALPEDDNSPLLPAECSEVAPMNAHQYRTLVKRGAVLNGGGFTLTDNTLTSTQARMMTAGSGPAPGSDGPDPWDKENEAAG